MQVQKDNGELNVDVEGQSSVFAYTPIVAATDGLSGSAAGGGLVQLTAQGAAFNVTHPEQNQVRIPSRISVDPLFGLHYVQHGHIGTDCLHLAVSYN